MSDYASANEKGGGWFQGGYLLVDLVLPKPPEDVSVFNLTFIPPPHRPKDDVGKYSSGDGDEFSVEFLNEDGEVLEDKKIVTLKKGLQSSLGGSHSIRDDRKSIRFDFDKIKNAKTFVIKDKKSGTVRLSVGFDALVSQDILNSALHSYVLDQKVKDEIEKITADSGRRSDHRELIKRISSKFQKCKQLKIERGRRDSCEILRDVIEYYLSR